MSENVSGSENSAATAAHSHRVVAGVDGSEASARAARWAAQEALDRGVPLVLIQAGRLPDGPAGPLEPGAYAREARDKAAAVLRSAASSLREEFPDLSVDTEESDQSAAQALIGLSRQADVVVTGTRGHGGFAGMLLGSVSRKLAAHAHCPLVVVRGEQAGSIDEVVLGVEPDQTEGPIRFAFTVAQRCGATLHAVRAWRPRGTFVGPTGSFFESYSEIQDAQHREIERLLAAVRRHFPRVPVEVTSSRGNPVPILIETARETRLLVVGARRHSGLTSVGAGYVVEGLLAHSPTPVAVVPASWEPSPYETTPRAGRA